MILIATIAGDLFLTVAFLASGAGTLSAYSHGDAPWTIIWGMITLAFGLFVILLSSTGWKLWKDDRESP